MRKRRNNDFWLLWIALALTLTVCVLLFFFRTRTLVSVAARSQAETVLLNAANRAVETVLDENGISYDSIARLSKEESGRITGLEINITEINLMKSRIAAETVRLVEQTPICRVGIPIGSFLGNEYLDGWGPKIYFRMQLTATAFVDFKSNFSDAGINQTLHQILVSIDLTGNLIAAGYTDSIPVHTDAIAAQTVIVGVVPDAFTDVIEAEGSDRAGEVFDYSVLESPKK